MSVDVIRLGEEDNFCSVCYETVDVSALAGVTGSSKSVRKCWLKEWQQSRHHCACLCVGAVTALQLHLFSFWVTLLSFHTDIYLKD